METSWTINSVETMQQLASNPPYNDANTSYSHEYCIQSNACLIFTIRDSFGDGLCCSFGEGNFQVTLNSDQSVSGGTFELETSVQIGTPSCFSSGSNAADMTDFLAERVVAMES